MKITKIMLAAALCLSLFACTQEDADVSGTQSTVNTKNSGLTQAEVEDLTDQCEVLSLSSDFIQMRAASQEFLQKMNYNIENWRTPSQLAKWLNINLNQTQFQSAQDALDSFANVSSLSKNFYASNASFFQNAFLGTPGQIKIILEPISVNPGPSPIATQSCDDDCLDAYDNSLNHAFNGWKANLDYADLTGDPSDYTYAEDAYLAHTQAAYIKVWECFDACDGE